MNPHYFSNLAENTAINFLDRCADSFAAPGLLALLPETDLGQLPALQTLCRERKLKLLGGIFPALITPNGFVAQGAILSSFDAALGHAFLPDLPADPGQAAAAIAAALPEQSLRNEKGATTLFLLFDSQVPNIGSILAKLFDLLRHHVRYLGINAGSESFQPIPCLFDGERCAGGGVLCLLLPTETPAAVAHCYPVTKSLSRATSTEHNRIALIDGKPAMTAYKELIMAEFGVELTPENFYHYAVHYPFGLISSLDVLVRIPVGFTEDGSIICVGEIPPNSLLRLLRAPEPSDRSCVDKLSGLLQECAPNLLAFYCAGRRLNFGPEAEAELRDLGRACQATAVLGALSLGEISTDGQLNVPEFHNAAIVCLA